jgi:hypothetical protein
MGDPSMKTIETTQTAGPDKLVHVTIPVDQANRPYRMVIVVVPTDEATATSNTNDRGWPPGFIESTYGSIQDETFIRHLQGEYEKRLKFK